MSQVSKWKSKVQPVIEKAIVTQKQQLLKGDQISLADAFEKNKKKGHLSEAMAKIKIWNTRTIVLLIVLILSGMKFATAQSIMFKEMTLLNITVFLFVAFALVAKVFYTNSLLRRSEKDREKTEDLKNQKMNVILRVTSGLFGLIASIMILVHQMPNMLKSGDEVGLISKISSAVISLSFILLDLAFLYSVWDRTSNSQKHVLKAFRKKSFKHGEQNSNNFSTPLKASRILKDASSIAKIEPPEIKTPLETSKTSKSVGKSVGSNKNQKNPSEPLSPGSRGYVADTIKKFESKSLLKN